MKRYHMVISILSVISLFVVAFIVWLVNPFTAYGTANDIKVYISPQTIVVKDYNQTININIELKNEANSDRKIMEFVYSLPSESIYCTLKTNNSIYGFITPHGDYGGRPICRDRVLKPGDTFNFRIQIPLFQAKNLTSKEVLHNDDSKSCELSVVVRIYNTTETSNVIQITRTA